jgi:SAM-dependent methyltransferase
MTRLSTRSIRSRSLTALVPRTRYALHQMCPPIVWSTVGVARRRGWLSGGVTRPQPGGDQDLEAYWDPKYASVLDRWGEGNVWVEIPLLLCGYQGRVLDIACGTGRTIQILGNLPAIEVHGCDISDLLIEKAVERGVPRDRLVVCDARATPYADEFFDYSYSIGSLEHFTTEGIPEFIEESARITRVRSFHQIPVSKSGREEGWIHYARQSYHNNPVDWWLERFRAVFPSVTVLDSVWQDGVSVGKWFVCGK